MLSVVIPTKNRAATLRRTLERLRRQAVPSYGFEVIIVDNGSSDDTASVLERAAADFGGRLIALSETTPGPAAARNTGARAATGEVLMFLGDDMLPARDDLLAGHVERHRAHPEETYAVLGRVEWSPDEPVTPFMWWLEHGGPQFAFDRLSPGPVDAAGFFYTSQVSLKRTLFERVGGFDERFPSAGVEDVEIGVRLAEAGIALTYEPDLLVHHEHHTTVASAERRMRMIGRAGALYAVLHPDRPNRSFQPLPQRRAVLFRLARPALRALAPLPLPARARRRIWASLMLSAVDRGFREGAPSAIGCDARLG